MHTHTWFPLWDGSFHMRDFAWLGIWKNTVLTRCWHAHTDTNTHAHTQPHTHSHTQPLFHRKQEQLTFDLYHSACLENTKPGIDQHSSHPDSPPPPPSPSTLPILSTHPWLPFLLPFHLSTPLLHHHTINPTAVMLWACSSVRFYCMTTHTHTGLSS